MYYEVVYFEGKLHECIGRGLVVEQAIELLDADVTSSGYFTCIFGTDPFVSNPIAFDGSAVEVERVLSQLPLLGPVQAALSPSFMSASGTSTSAVYRRWVISFVSYVGSPTSLLTCSTVSSGAASASARQSQRRCRRNAYSLP